MDCHPTWCPDHLEASAERFLSRVDTSGECWLWLGGRNHAQYGYAQLIGARKHTMAHRVAYMLATGAPIPQGVIVRHTCDNPPCVFPGHLLLGSKRDNAQDMARRGRARSYATGPLPGNLSTVGPTPAPHTRKRTPRATDPPPLDLEAQAAQQERRARYGA